MTAALVSRSTRIALIIGLCAFVAVFGLAISVPRLLGAPHVLVPETEVVGPCRVDAVADESWRTKNGSWFAVDTECGSFYMTNEALLPNPDSLGRSFCLWTEDELGRPSARILDAAESTSNRCPAPIR